MIYKNLNECVLDLEKRGELIRISEEVNPDLEIAMIHTRINKIGGPALLFENIKGSPFAALSNLYGTKKRIDYIFKDTLPPLKRMMEIKANPNKILKKPLSSIGLLGASLNARPKKVSKADVMWAETTIDKLPMIKSWPMDGGAFITLPQVMSLDPRQKDIMHSNVGMYRIQMAGNEYKINEELGLHYQLHRGIGVHHNEYKKRNETFRVSIFIGGPPAHAVAAIFPLPENVPEVVFAGLLGGRRFRYKDEKGAIISADADFCITGTISNKLKPEGPFGDHMGYYSLEHDFPVLKVDKVYHKKDAIWHFTVVGRPPAEDSMFGYLIHKIIEPLASKEFPGLIEINAVDQAGVHPLLLVIGEERYMPFRDKKPEELLTIANRILGTGQTSLAKYLFITTKADNSSLSTSNIEEYFNYILERIDWKKDLHFQTKTTIDTLDYSGDGWNSGSKVVIACHSAKRRDLAIKKLDLSLPFSFSNTKVISSGILSIEGPKFDNYVSGKLDIEQLIEFLKEEDLSGFPLIIISDDSQFMTESFDNFLWATFTRSNPSHDIYGIGEAMINKHWGCSGSLIIDARKKPHHAPELIESEELKEKVDRIVQRIISKKETTSNEE